MARELIKGVHIDSLGYLRLCIPIHMHVVAAEIQSDKKLEQNGILWIGGREVAEQTRSRASF